ncbi:MAG: hypothetical protein KAG89_08760 [Fulvimarina manganoxydans]|uniref:hypothetical protein n=1 Tax=Fulvimarina manganoxydans TaxID=937218 RepID=UPI002354FE3E|nr:hypothetical protein [Fulvimarina manganoxydans]MCK5932245.1 hypothetical protein [Fulvimarina manganoxydans]
MRDRLAGLVKFSNRKEWRDWTDDIFELHFGQVLDEFDLEFDELQAILGEALTIAVMRFALEDCCTRPLDEDDATCLTDLYLKKRGYTEGAGNRAFLAAFAQSTVSLFEIVEVRSNTSLLIRDRLTGGDAFEVTSQAETSQAEPGRMLAARLVRLKDETILTTGYLPYTSRAFDLLVAGLKVGIAEDPNAADTMSDDELAMRLKAIDSRSLTPFFTISWLLGTLPDSIPGSDETILTSEGDPYLLFKAHYPLPKGVAQKHLKPTLDGIEALHRVRDGIYDWIGEAPADEGEERFSPDLRDIDGNLILGHVELKGRELIFTTTSDNRGERGRAMIEGALGDTLGKPRIQRETMDEAGEDMSMLTSMTASRFGDGFGAGMLPADIIDGAYRAALDMPLDDFGGRTPREAAKSPESRAAVADWLRSIEAQFASLKAPNSMVGDHDVSWLWPELGLDRDRD